MSYRTISNCRLCCGQFFAESLKLKDSPLANELYDDVNSAKAASKFPLELVMCSQCRHVQLRDIVDSHRLFGKYIYKSGTSGFFRNHFNSLAKTISRTLPKSSLVVEIGSNDGFLLHCLEKYGFIAVGIEPSKILAEKSTSEGLSVIHDFLSENCINQIQNRYGAADMVVANNVFAHIEDMNGALNIIGELLSPDGVFIFEVAHLLKLIENNYFDTIYHEHMSYHSLESLILFLENHKFYVFNVEEIDAHGGSLRIYASRNKTWIINPSVSKVLEKEVLAQLSKPNIFELLQQCISSKRVQVQRFISAIDKDSVIFGYGAPAKLVTFLSEMELEGIELLGVIDDNFEKQGKFLPSSAFPILPVEVVKTKVLRNQQPVTCLIFPWNLGDELVAKLRTFMPESSKAICFFPQVKVEEF